MSGVRVAPGTRDQLGLPLWVLTRLAGRVVGTAPPALFTVLGRHRRLLLTWLPFAGALMPRGRLPRHDTELVILRVAALRGCAYERAHHVRIARRVGLTDDEIERLGHPEPPGPWTARDQLLLAATAVLAAGGDLDDALWAALDAELTEIECVELVVLAAHYAMLAAVISALRIPPDPPRARPARR